MAGAKSGKAPGKIFAPGGSEVFSDEGRDYFDDKGFSHEGSLEQVKQRWKDVDRLQDIKREERAPKRYYKGGSVKHGSSTCVHSRTKG